MKSRSEPGQIKATLVSGRSGWGRFKPPRPSGAVASRHSHQSPAPAHHGQNPAQELPHRHALHQTRRRSGRGHRHPRPIPPQALRAFPACALSAGQGLLRWILRPVLRGPLHRRGPAARGGTPFVVCATAAESGRSGAGAPPVLRRRRHHLPGKSEGGRDHDQRPVRGADSEGSRVILLENAQDVGDLFAVTRAGPAPADHDPLADIGGCEADLEPVAHAGHLFPGRAARRRVPGPGPGAWIVAGLGAAAGSGGRLRVGDGGMMPF